MRRRVFAAIGVGLIAVGCARTGARSPGAAYLEQLERNPQALVARVATVRQLPQLRATPVVFHDEDDFVRQLGPRETARASESGSATVFGHEAAADAPDTMRAVEHEQVVAFYDPDEHAVHVRRSALVRADDPERAAWIIAHEIGHSLQHQHFPVPDVASLSGDEQLAALALVEGDAMLTMAAFIADAGHEPLNRTVARAKRAIQSGVPHAYARVAGDSRELLEAPAWVRERLSFPYLSGLLFVGAIHRAGGFGLVNQLYRAPPTTTEQILHPERYLAGDLPVPVGVPPAPRGWRTVAAGRFGELQTRLTVERCAGPQVAAGAAAGWGGDAYAIVQRGSERGLLWSTIWDSEHDAVEFEHAAHALMRCWGEHGAGVVRAGLRVALVRGRVGVAPQQLLALAGARPPPRAPLGNVSIPGERAVLRVNPPYVSGAQFVYERLGVWGPVPFGFGARVDDGDIVFARESPPATVLLTSSELLTDQRGLAELLRQSSDPLREAAGGRRVEELGRRNVHTPLGPGVEARWRVSGSAASYRVTAVPICRGTGSIVILQLWSGESAAELDAWLGQLKPLASGDPPACAELDP